MVEKQSNNMSGEHGVLQNPPGTVPSEAETQTPAGQVRACCNRRLSLCPIQHEPC